MYWTATLENIQKSFTYKGKRYTPQTFAKDVVGINPDDYVELTSYKDYPYYQRFVALFRTTGATIVCGMFRWMI